MPRRYLGQKQVFVSLPFLTGLAILLLNDFVLKAVFHNWITGKLSDFAGLLVFPMFLAALLPRRRDFIYAATAIAFLIWKSTYSQPVIQFANILLPIHVHRTQDFSDIIAIVVLPISWMYSRARAGITPSPSWHKSPTSMIVCLISIFAFAATSTVPPDQTIPYEKDYEFDLPVKELASRLEDLDLELQLFMAQQKGKFELRSYDIFLDGRLVDCQFGGAARAKLTLDVASDVKSTLHLKTITYPCESPVKEDKESLLRAFETQVIGKLSTQK